MTLRWQVDTSGIDKILSNSERNHDMWVRALSTEIVSDIKLSYGTSPGGRKYKRGRRYHTASIEGHPPNVDTGKLRASIRWESIGIATTEVTSDQKHAVYQEIGTQTISKRPHFRPVFTMWQGKLQQHYRDFNTLLRNTGLSD